MENEDTNRTSELQLVKLKTSPMDETVSIVKRERKSPNCGRCKKHGVYVPLIGHKGFCRFRNCYCVMCKETLKRRKEMAKQTAYKRALQLKMKKKILPEEVEPVDAGNVTSEPVKKKRKRDDSDEDSLPTPLIPTSKFCLNPDDNFRVLLEHTLTLLYQFCVTYSQLLPIAGNLIIILEYIRMNAPINLTQAQFNISQASIIHHPKIIHRLMPRDMTLSFRNRHLTYYLFSFMYYLFPP